MAPPIPVETFRFKSAPITAADHSMLNLLEEMSRDCARCWFRNNEQKAKLFRSALGQDALKRAAVHIQSSGGFRHIAIAELKYTLDMFPTHPVC